MIQRGRLFMTYPRVTTILSLAIYLCNIPSASARMKYSGDYLSTVKPTFITPHVQWAKPYAQGTTKVLFIVPYWAGPREIVELWQRFDIEFDAVTIFHAGLLASTDPWSAQIEGTSPDDKLLQLRAALEKKWDVIFLANVNFNALPAESQYHLLKQVSEGTGLIFTCTWGYNSAVFKQSVPEANKITTGVPITALPYFKKLYLERTHLKSMADVPARLVKTYEFGKGRVVTFDFADWHSAYYGGTSMTPEEDYTYQSPTYYNYYQSLVAKAVAWAARKEPQVTLINLPEDGQAIEQINLPLKTGVILRRITAKDANLTLKVAIRNENNEVEFNQTQKLVLMPNEDAKVPITLPLLKGGLHFLDFWVVNSKKAVENWASVSFRVNSQVKLTDLTTDTESYERDQTVKGTVRLQGEIISLKTPSLRVQLVDNYDRIFYKDSAPLATGDLQTFMANLDHAVALMARVQVALLSDGKVVDQVEKEIAIPRRLEKRYKAIIWGGAGPGLLGHLGNERLREGGFSAVLLGDPRLSAMDDLTTVPYITRIPSGKIDDVEYSFTDPIFRNKLADSLKKSAAKIAPYGCLVYSLGDENYLPDNLGFSASDKAQFCTWLQQRYGHLDTLNQVWGSQLTDWSQAEPITLKEAQEKKQYARYGDSAAYREFLYADQHHWCSKAIKEADPYAKVGAEGSVPGDLEETIKGLEMWSPYGDHFGNTLQRSIAPKGLIRGNWWGGYLGQRDKVTLKYLLWQWLLDGSNSLWYFAAGGGEGLFRTDLGYSEHFEWIREDIQELNRGVGKLIEDADPVSDGVALHASQTCIHASQLVSDINNFDAAHDNFLNLLEDLQFQHHYLTRSQIEAGRLAKGDVKVLALPYSQAISDKEATSLKQFVEEGGWLIADLRPGVMDSHCNLLAKGQLDDVFGIQRKAGKAEVKSMNVRLDGEIEGKPLLLDLPLMLVDSAVTATTSKPAGKAGETPLMLVNRCGKGGALLLNCNLSQYSAMRENGKEDGLRQLFTDLLQIAGVKAKYTITNEKGFPIKRCRASIFRYGAATLIGLIKTPYALAPEKETVTIKLPSSVSLYDVRTGISLGKKSLTNILLQPGMAKVLCALPYEVVGMNVQAPVKANAGQSILIKATVKTRGGEAGRHLLDFRILGPDDRTREYYSGSAVAEKGTATFLLPLAVNDPAGQWKVVVTDVLTGVKNTVFFSKESSMTLWSR